MERRPWGEAVQGATSPDDGVPTYGEYSAAARAGVMLVMVEGVRGGETLVMMKNCPRICDLC